MISADFQSQKLVTLLLVATIKTDRKAKYNYKCRIKVETSVTCRDTQQPSCECDMKKSQILRHQNAP